MSNDTCQMTNEEWANHDPPVCPFCRGSDIDGMGDDNWCNACGRYWQAVVKVVGYVEVDPFIEIEINR